MKSLKLPTDMVKVYRIMNAPQGLRDIDVTGNGTHVYVVPDNIAERFLVRDSLSHSVIDGGTVYII